MTRRNKILHVQKVSGVAGSENHLLALLPALDDTKYDVKFLALEPSGKSADELLTRLRASGLKTHRISLRGDIDPICVYRLRTYLSSEHIDLLHTHLFHADVHGALAVRLSPVHRLVSTRHGPNRTGWKSQVSRIRGIMARNVDWVIAISEYLEMQARNINRMRKDRISTIHYGVREFPSISFEMKEEIRLQLAIGSDQIIVANVARLIPFKGHRYLLEALQLLISDGLELHLLIVGDGPMEAELKARSIELGISRNISFLGRRDDVAELLAASDIFAFSSSGEGFGLAVLEAMAAGRPVVAFSATSIPEIVQDGVTGILVPERDTHAFARALGYLASNPEERKRMGDAGRRRAHQEFSLHKMVAKTQAIYDELLN